MDLTGLRASASVGGVFAYLVRHRTAANLLLLLMIVAGVVAGTRLRTQFFPDIVIEVVTVSVAWSGAGPQDIDDAVIALLEPQLLTVEGVTEITSVARESRATITLEFEPGWDMQRAVDEVKSAVDGVTTLPDDAEQPVFRRGAFRDRITDVVISGPVGIDQLTRFGDELQARLFRAGVTRTSLRGVAEPVIRVSVPEAMLHRHQLALRDVADAIAAESARDPAGDLGTRATRVRTGTERRDAATVGDVAVRSLPDGGKLLVRDVATIELEGVERGTAYYSGDDPAIVLRVERGADGDTIALQALVARTVDEMRATLPPGVTIILTRTRAEAVSDRLEILVRNGATGLVLVLGFLFLFLSARTAFWVAAGIPTAMAATIALMWAFGLTLNMVSLFALILCLGIVVDDAIVVGEHADHLARHGMKPADAAVAAARRMAAPVFSASITTIIAFAALTAVGGRFGRLIFDIPFTVAVVLLASLAEAFLILPAHMRHALAANQRSPWYDAPSRTFNRGFVWFRERVFRRVLRLAIAARYPVVGAAVMLLLVSAALFVDGTVRWRFFNAPERAVISANIAMLPGATRDDTRAMLDEMRRALDAVDARFAEQHGTAPVVSALATVGGTAGRGLHSADAKDRDLLGGFSVELIDPDQRPYSAFAFIADWQDEIRQHPLLETLALRGHRSGPGGDAIDVELTGPDSETLKAAAEALKVELSRFRAVSALEDTLAYDKTELILTLTPLGEALGFTTDAVGRALRDRLEGIEAAEFAIGARTAEIRVAAPEDELTHAYLYQTRLGTPGGGYVPLSEIVEIDARLGYSAIRRENGLQVVSVTGDIAEDDAEAAAEVTRALADTLLPDLAARFDVDYRLGGLAEQEHDFLSDAALGFGLCLAGIYLTLAWIFASWTRPLVVMAVIPFGVIGMIWGHHWHGLPLSMFSVVGLIGMSGIIINDSIVLVTTIDGLATRRPLLAAVIDGSADRLRAVLLTT
ncbi:MAG: efflux RND transporter permease subunit, partial [Alphaproteobacteria bacterium]